MSQFSCNTVQRISLQSLYGCITDLWTSFLIYFNKMYSSSTLWPFPITRFEVWYTIDINRYHQVRNLTDICCTCRIQPHKTTWNFFTWYNSFPLTTSKIKSKLGCFNATYCPYKKRTNFMSNQSNIRVTINQFYWCKIIINYIIFTH